MLKVIVTGPNGLVGRRVIELLKNDFEFIPLSHTDIDITNKEAVAEKLSTMDFDLLLHLAAYTNVEGAEKDRSQTYLINVDGTSNLFHVIEERKKKMIYISTDFVFDGKNPPFDENSKPNPMGYYAQTKYHGEKVVQGGAMIVRISVPYGNIHSEKPDLMMRIKQMLQEGQELTMSTDSSVTPTFIDDIAMSLKYLMTNYNTDTYHIVGTKAYSPFEIGTLVANTFNLNAGLIKQTSFDEYSQGKAPRPQYSEIISIKNTFHPMKNLEEGLLEVKKQLDIK